MGVRFSLPAPDGRGLPSPSIYMKPKILIIVGPTAVGKSDLAVELAHKFNGEVISADSRQVYTGLDIGTGKITSEEMKGVPHHLLDVADPKDQFTVTQWRALAETAIADIINRGKLPILCGGTGFYISTLIDDITLPDAPADQALRDELSTKTIPELFTLLEQTNPERAQSMNQSDKNNPRRLIRAIEIARHAATTEASASPTPTAHESSYDPLWIGINLPLPELHTKIQNRLEKRINQGMITEVQNLHDTGVSWERMEELGLEYRYIARQIQGTITLEKMREKLVTEINQYAKRQMTWFKRNKLIRWFTPADVEAIETEVKTFLG